METSALRCGPFRLDFASERLWRDGQPIDITPKAWAVLRHLVERAGELVTKGDLLDAVWGDVAVGEGSLSKTIFELRNAFGDTAQTPRFIQTVHRRGFRFIAPLEEVTARQPDRRAAAAP